MTAPDSRTSHRDQGAPTRSRDACAPHSADDRRSCRFPHHVRISAITPCPLGAPYRKRGRRGGPDAAKLGDLLKTAYSAASSHSSATDGQEQIAGEDAARVAVAIGHTLRRIPSGRPAGQYLFAWRQAPLPSGSPGSLAAIAVGPFVRQQVGDGGVGRMRRVHQRVVVARPPSLPRFRPSPPRRQWPSIASSESGRSRQSSRGHSPLSTIATSSAMASIGLDHQSVPATGKDMVGAWKPKSIRRLAMSSLLMPLRS